MTVPGVSCKALATQNSSKWPCSMCPIPPGSGLWGWGHPTYIFLIFPGHPELWTPLQIPSWGPPLGCTLLQSYRKKTELSFGPTQYNENIIFSCCAHALQSMIPSFIVTWAPPFFLRNSGQCKSGLLSWNAEKLAWCCPETGDRIKTQVPHWHK